MLLPLITLAVLLLTLGFPIFIALGFPPILVALSEGIPLTLINQRLWGGIDKFSIMAMPFFILAANLMGRGGISKRIVHLANVLVGRFTGGPALTTTLACMFFGALSGSSSATVVAIGSITKPVMDQSKYENSFSVGLIMASSSLAAVIPPSIAMIIYATVSSVSVGALFIAGVVPGLFMGLLYMIYSYWYAKRKQLRYDQVYNNTEILKAFKGAGWALGIPVIIIGGIYGGIFTPTEASVVSVVYAMLVGIFVYRELGWKSLNEACLESALLTAQLMVLVAGASVLSWMLTISEIQNVVSGLLEWSIDMPWLLLILINLVLVIAGMFVDPASMTLILAPIVVPLATKIGVDPIHLGIIFICNAAVGMFSPPFGLNLFVAKASYSLSFRVLARAALPFVLISLIGLLAITFIPNISLWLPNMVYGK